MRVRTRLTAGLVAAAAAIALTACGGEQDGQQDNVPTVPPASAEQSPRGGAAPAGVVVPQEAGSRLAVSGDTAAVLAADGRSVALHRVPDGTAPPQPPRRVEVPGAGLVDLIAAGDGFLGVGPDGLTRIAADGGLTRAASPIDEPLSVALRRGAPLVGTAKGTIVVFSADDRREREIGGFVRVDQILVAPDDAPDVGGQVTVLDRAQSAIMPVDVDNGEHKAALRAGNGATNAVVDRFGRISVTGTRDDEFYGFFGAPIVMRLRHPAPDGPYAIAYDDARNLLWVSTTGTNEALAYDLSSGDARERARIATVGQVGAMTVDPRTGSLLLVSTRGDGLQRVPAGAVTR